ncbi:MAG: glycerate kinase, partial [Cellulosimicrobium funkei]
MSSTPSTTPNPVPGPRADGPLRVVVAPDSFNGSLCAADVAHAVATGVRSVVTDAEVGEL